jgi:predicted DNA-binding transcriptional regulator AlpA
MFHLESMDDAANKPFDELSTNDTAPVEGLMRKPEVLKLLGCHDTTLWRLCRDHKFPQPVHPTSRLVAWRRAEVLKWFRNLK